MVSEEDVPKKICLNMIFRQEEHVIKRCLDNIKHLCDSYVCVNTYDKDEDGVEDKSTEIIKDVMGKAGIPGDISYDVWDKDFGRSRTLAIRRAEVWLKSRGENLDHWFLMFMDADNHVHRNDEQQDIFDGKKFYLTENMRKGLKAHRYHVDMKSGETKYSYAWMVSLSKTWKWEYPLHEYVTTDEEGIIPSKIEGCYVYSGREGNRSKNPNKYSDDAEVFKKFLVDKPDDARATFYLAQSLRDAGKHEEAAEYYIKRGEITNSFYEERYSSYIEAAKIRASMFDKYDLYLVLGHLSEAMNICNWRKEAAYFYIRICRHKEKYGLGYRIGKAFLDIKKEEVEKKSLLFIDQMVYDWGFDDEYSVCAFYSEKYDVAYKHMCLAAPFDSERIGKNLGFFKKISKDKWHPDYISK
jgi:tetratricopeptide (TPR) repeat protein